MASNTSSGLRLDATTSQDLVAASSRYDQAWCIGSLFRKFRYRRKRYSMIKGSDPTYFRRRQNTEEIVAEYYGPSWLINRVWRLQAFKGPSGWTFSPRTYNVVPAESLVFSYVEENNLSGLQELFSMKLASPFDCDNYGFTPLMVNILYPFHIESFKADDIRSPLIVVITTHVNS